MTPFPAHSTPVLSSRAQRGIPMTLKSHPSLPTLSSRARRGIPLWLEFRCFLVNTGIPQSLRSVGMTTRERMFLVDIYMTLASLDEEMTRSTRHSERSEESLCVWSQILSGQRRDSSVAPLLLNDNQRAYVISKHEANSLILIARKSTALCTFLSRGNWPTQAFRSGISTVSAALTCFSRFPHSNRRFQSTAICNRFHPTASRTLCHRDAQSIPHTRNKKPSPPFASPSLCVLALKSISWVTVCLGAQLLLV